METTLTVRERHALEHLRHACARAGERVRVPDVPAHILRRLGTRFYFGDVGQYYFDADTIQKISATRAVARAPTLDDSVDSDGRQ